MTAHRPSSSPRATAQPAATPAARPPAPPASCWSPFRIARLLACLAAAAYVIVRCFTLALTGDEWGLILDDIQKGLTQLLIQGHIDVQSTFLLVFLGLINMTLLTSNPIAAIRLPNALAFLLYLWAAWKITERVKSPALSFLGFVALCANAYMLDFFSIGRGYGLALGFQLLSLHCFLRALEAARREAPAWRNWCIGSVWAASVSVLAIVAFLDFYFALLGSCLLLTLFQARRRNPDWRAALPATLLDSLHLVYNAALLGIFYLPRVLILNLHHCFYAGESGGMIRSTIYSLVKLHFYLRPPPDNVIFLLTLIVWGSSVLIAVALVFRRARLATEPASEAGLYFSLMLAIMAVFHILLFQVTGTLFPVGRAALCFFPLYVLQVICLGAAPNRLSRLTAPLILLASIAIGLSGANWQRTQVYNCSAQHPAVIDEIARIHEETGRPVVLGVTDRLKYTLWWYAEHRLGLAPRPNPENIHDGLMRRFDWLTIYTLHYGEYRLFSAETSHVLLDLDEMTTNEVPEKLESLQDYPIAHVRLYRRLPARPLAANQEPTLSIVGTY